MQLLEVLETVKPKLVFPVHCERPTLFKKFLEGSFKVEIPKVQEAYEV
jgi:hypothetical protein